MAHEISNITTKTQLRDASSAATATEYRIYARAGCWRRHVHAAMLLIIPLTALALPPLEFAMQLSATFCSAIFIYLHLRHQPLSWCQLQVTTVSAYNHAYNARRERAPMPRLSAWHHLNSQQAFYVSIDLSSAITARPLAFGQVDGLPYRGRLHAHSLVSDVGIYLCWQQGITDHDVHTQSRTNPSIPISGQARDRAPVLYGYWLYRDELSEADFRTLSRICQSVATQGRQPSVWSLSER